MAKKQQTYTFQPVGLDLFHRKDYMPQVGAKVIKTQPYGCPKNGTMGMTYVACAETGKFYGLVNLKSLVKA